MYIVYDECLSDNIYKYSYDCIFSIVSLYGWPHFQHLCIACSECDYLDWTINYLSTTTTTTIGGSQEHFQIHDKFGAFIRFGCITIKSRSLGNMTTLHYRGWRSMAFEIDIMRNTKQVHTFTDMRCMQRSLGNMTTLHYRGWRSMAFEIDIMRNTKQVHTFTDMRCMQRSPYRQVSILIQSRLSLNMSM